LSGVYKWYVTKIKLFSLKFLIDANIPKHVKMYKMFRLCDWPMKCMGCEHLEISQSDKRQTVSAGLDQKLKRWQH
jgi:hypothetical protein